MRQVLDYQSRGPGRRLWPILWWSLALTVAALFLAAVFVPMLVPEHEYSGPSTVTDLSNFKTALGVFEWDNGRYPTTTEGLGALLTCPPGLGATWRGPYVNRVPLDKWGHPFIYRCPGTKNPASYDLISAGPDGVLGTADDIDKDDAF
jgi:type II secretion system protein G